MASQEFKFIFTADNVNVVNSIKEITTSANDLKKLMNEINETFSKTNSEK